MTCERCAAGESWDTHHCHACGLVDGHEPDCVRKHGLGYDGLHAWHSEACTLLRERDEARADLAHCRDELADTARHCARIMSERDALRAALERIAAMARPDGDLAAHVAWHALRAALARGDGRAT